MVGSIASNEGKRTRLGQVNAPPIAHAIVATTLTLSQKGDAMPPFTPPHRQCGGRVSLQPCGPPNHQYFRAGYGAELSQWQACHIPLSG